MKTAIKGISLFLAAVLCLGILAACDFKKTPTVEEIFKIFDETENCKITMTVTSEASENGVSAKMTVDMDAKADGDLMYTLTTSSLSITAGGQSQSNTTKQEAYQKVEGDTITMYSKEEGAVKWTKSTQTVTEEDLESMAATYKKLFDPELYGKFDKATGRYSMKEDARVTIDLEDAAGSEFFGAYVEYKDGAYTLYSQYTSGGANCTLKLTISDIGSVSLTLPEGVEG